jgi:large subunit ribosomal protein L21
MAVTAWHRARRDRIQILTEPTSALRRTMYAVIETGGKQYRVELGSELAVERLEGNPGDTVNFDRVLLVADGESAQIGTPIVSEALVTASVVRQDRAEKVIVFKYRPKARRRVKKGHRQEQTVLRVADIRFNGRSAADEAGAQEKQETKARKAAAAEAERKAAADQALAAKLAEEAAEASTDAADKAETAKPKTTKTSTRAKTAAKPKAEAAAPDTASADADQASTQSADKPAPKPRARRTTTKKDE